MKAFVLVFDPSRVDRETVVKRIDDCKDIKNWYAFFGNTMCLATDLDTKALSAVIRDAFPGLKFLVLDVDPDGRSGWLPQSVWTFLDHPHPAEAELV